MGDHTNRWQRISRPHIQDPLHAMRRAIAEIRKAPLDIDARRELRALALDPETREQLALVLTDEVHRTNPPEVSAAFYEELADVYENLDQPLETISAMEAVCALEPDDVDHLDRLAWLYRRAGAAGKAAETFVRVAGLAPDHRSRSALHAAGKLYRETTQLDRATDVYRAIIAAHPRDQDAWRAVDELLAAQSRWGELAELRGMMAHRASGNVEKAALLRSKARAHEQAGDASGAAEAVARATSQAPEDISGVVDYAMVLARAGRGTDAATQLRTRITEAQERNAPPEDVWALRAQLAATLEDACGDRAASATVLAELLAEAPDYVPALERLVWQASHDPDPQAYPAAILRHAHALPAGPDKAALLIEAGARFRDAHDYRAATQAYEAACELVGDHDLRTQLDEVRAALEVERALADTERGDTVRAEQRLRALVRAQPMNFDAVTALTDLYASNARHDEACELLRETLAAADSVPRRTLAPLVLRYATAVAALGEADQAHRLLHDAHAMDRRDLRITLALGESCFQRRLWREAAIHLGSLAEHPDAARHGPAVAAGLVHAAQAETRALRPQNAEKRYLAAVALDPKCARAWHELAELAMERGDAARGADCLEHEAEATTDPTERLRLFDALGDLAIDMLEDPVRAERCWMQIAELGSIETLRKLVVIQRARGAGVERGEVCERLSELATDRREKRDLAIEAAQAFQMGGEGTRARRVAQRLVGAYPHDPDAVASATAIWRDAGDHARVASWLVRALATWDGAGDRGEGDPRRAELWRRLGDAERGKGDTKAAERAFERAVALAPDSDGAHAARRGLVDLGTNASAGLLAALVEAEQNPADVLTWARELQRENKLDDARAAYELAIALGAKDDDPAVPRGKDLAPDEAYPAQLDQADRGELIDDPDEAGLAIVLEVLGEAMSRIAPDARTALAGANLAGAQRISALHKSTAAKVFPQIAKVLGTPPILLYEMPLYSKTTPVVLAAPPLLFLSATLLANDDAVAVRFELGRLVELSRPRRVFCAGTSPEAFARLVAGVVAAFGPHAPHIQDKAVAAEAERLRAALPVQNRRFLTDYLATAAPLDPAAYTAACLRAADRAGLLACGRTDVALRLAGGPRKAAHLVRMAASPRYLQARAKLRKRP